MSTAHPDEETLLALAAGALAGSDGAGIRAHVQSCRDCDLITTALARRLPQDLPARPEVDPALIARAVASARSHRPSPLAVRTPARPSLIRDWRVRTAMAIAAGVVLWIGIAIDWSSDAGELNRSVTVEHTLYVKRASVDVRELARADAPAISVLHRGERVEVVQKNGDWWQIRSESGAAGWVLRSELLSEDSPPR